MLYSLLCNSYFFKINNHAWYKSLVGKKRFLFLTIQDNHTTEIPFRIPEQAEQWNNIIVNSVIQ